MCGSREAFDGMGGRHQPSVDPAWVGEVALSVPRQIIRPTVEVPHPHPYPLSDWQYSGCRQAVHTKCSPPPTSFSSVVAYSRALPAAGTSVSVPVINPRPRTPLII